MSEEILKALTQLFAIIAKQDDGVTENERQFAIRFFQQELDQDSIEEYIALYDDVSGYKLQQLAGGIDKNKQTSVKDSVKTLGICRKINKTLTQKQKIIVLIRIMEMIASESDYTSQPMEIINTVATVFNISEEEYKLVRTFVMSDSITELDLPDSLVVNSGVPHLSVWQKHLHAHINGNLIVIRIRSVDLYFAKYSGGDSNVLNGFAMQPNRVYLFPHGSAIKMPSGDALYYGDLVSNFNEEIKTAKLSFNAHIEEFNFPNGAVGLRNVIVAEGPGKLIGIMGASGAGKTTLLNVLAGLEKPSKGSIQINGLDILEDKEKLQGVIGYVAQDDLLIEELTVYQNLYYSTKLCMADLSEDELHRRVTEVLENLGLEQRKDLKVGSVLDKTISGGQRKRLNIALELIREPAVLFLDEPTSGLSSRDSENVIDLLKEISLKGKLVFVVIHQPSSDIYKMFDKMIIMDTGGYPAYYGLPVEAISYFKKATHQADGRGQCSVCATVNPEQIFSIIEARVVDEYGQPTTKRKVTPVQWFDLYIKNHRPRPVPHEKEQPDSSLSLPGKLKQASIFVVRDFLSKVGNRQYMLINLLEAPVLGLILSFIIRYKSSPNGSQYVFRFNDNLPAFLLMGIIVALFMGLTVSAEEVIRDRKILQRESFLNLSWKSYVLSKITLLFILSAIQTLSFVLISNWVLEIRGMTAGYWFILFSTSCFANLLGLNISSAFNSAVTVYIIIPLLLIPQMILSGLLFNYDKLNAVISTKGKVPLVADMMVSRWAMEALAVHQFKNNLYESGFFEYEKQQSGADFKSGYLAEELMNRNAFVLSNIQNNTDSVKARVDRDLALMRHTLSAEAFGSAFADENWPERLTRQGYSEQKDSVISRFLERYKRYYQNQYSENQMFIDKKMSFYEKHGWDLTENKNRYYNEKLSDLVRNIDTKHRLLASDGKIIQQIDPIFQSPAPDNLYDYRAPFFASQKNLLGFTIGTYAFNSLVMWLMNLLLVALLCAKFLSRAFKFKITFHKIFFRKRSGRKTGSPVIQNP